MDEGYEKALRILSRKHDVIAVHLHDILEKNFPSSGLVEFSDRENGQTILVDTASPVFRKRFQEEAAARQAALEKLFKQLQIDWIDIPANTSYVEPLFKFFKKRERK